MRLLRLLPKVPAAHYGSGSALDTEGVLHVLHEASHTYVCVRATRICLLLLHVQVYCYPVLLLLLLLPAQATHNT